MNARRNDITVIYDQSQPISLRKERQQEFRELRVVVSFLPGQVQMLSLHIIDEDNPSLLYLLKITDSEYEDLKKKQGFLVDFYHFPEQLVNVLEECKINKFILLVEDDVFGCQKYIKVIEENKLKQICHLSLTLNEPSSDELKIFLIDKIKAFKETNEMLHKEMKIALAKIIDFQTEFNTRNRLMQEEIGNEDKRFEEIKYNLLQEFKAQITRLRMNHFKVMNQLQTVNFNLMNKNGEQKETLRQQKLEVLRLQKNLITDKRHLEALHKQQDIVNYELSQKTKLAANLRMELAEMQEKGRKAEAVIRKMEEKIEVLNTLKNSLEDNVKKKESILTKKINALKTVSHCLYTTKSSMQTLEEENKSLDYKLKEAGNKILEQQTTLTQKNQEIASLVAKVKDQCSELQRFSLLEKEKNEHLLEIQNKEKILKYQTTVICQLQRKTTQLEAELVEAQRKASKERLLHPSPKIDTFERSAPIGAELSTFNSVRASHLDHRDFGRTVMTQQITEKATETSPSYAASSILNDEAVEESSSVIGAKGDLVAPNGVENVQQAVSKMDDKVIVAKRSKTGIVYPALQSLPSNERKRHPIPVLAPSTYFSSSAPKINK